MEERKSVTAAEIICKKELQRDGRDKERKGKKGRDRI